jgi:hypothetical protein
MLKIKTRYFQNDEKVGSWLSMEIKILPVIFKLSIFSEENIENKIGKIFLVQPHCMRGTPLRGLSMLERLFRRLITFYSYVTIL